MTNKRIIDVNEHIVSEALAPLTTINWDPTAPTLDATVNFQCARFFRYKVDGAYFGAAQPDGGLSIAASTLVGTMIPVMDNDGNIVAEIPAEVFIGALKGMFDQQYNKLRQAAGSPHAKP